VRSSTKTFVGLAGLGIVIAAARAGMPVPIAMATEAPAEPAQATETPAQTTPQPNEPTKAATPNTSKATPKPNPKATPAPAANVRSGDAIKYKYGTIQVKVTKDGGNITKVSYLKSSYTRVPSGTMTYLLQASVQANGSNFTNVSRATFTVDAFKKSLDSALGKF
jgi:uncharacterized protein with FMN-binding domain